MLLLFLHGAIAATMFYYEAKDPAGAAQINALHREALDLVTTSKTSADIGARIGASLLLRIAQMNEDALIGCQCRRENARTNPCVAIDWDHAKQLCSVNFLCHDVDLGEGQRHVAPIDDALAHELFNKSFNK